MKHIQIKNQITESDYNSRYGCTYMLQRYTLTMNKVIFAVSCTDGQTVECDSGVCLSTDVLCNQQDDCMDKSDERYCGA